MRFKIKIIEISDDLKSQSKSLNITPQHDDDTVIVMATAALHSDDDTPIVMIFQCLPCINNLPECTVTLTEHLP